MSLRDQIQERMAKNILVLKDTILYCSIRLGKTRIALKAIEPMDRILIVYPDKAIRKSWEDELEKFTPLSLDITFVTKASLHRYANTTWDYVIVDEPQLIQSNKQIEALKTIKYRKRVGLTGTLNNKTIKKFREELNWKVGDTYTIANAIADKLVKDYELLIHFFDLDDKNRMPYEKFGREFLASEKVIYEYYTQQMEYFKKRENDAVEQVDRLRAQMGYKKQMGLRTNFLYNSPTLLAKAKELVQAYKNEKVLIYTLRTDIADELSDVSYHSKNKEEEVLESFKEASEGHLAVVNSVRAGVTIKKLNKVLFHSYESNTEILYQKLGRSLLYEFEGEKSQIVICCLKNTQMESWIDQACRSLEQEKIFYVYNNKAYSKIEWLKLSYPDKELFFYDGAVVYRGEDIKGFGDSIIKQYYFLENPEKAYTLSEKKLIPL